MFSTELKNQQIQKNKKALENSPFPLKENKFTEDESDKRNYQNSFFPISYLNKMLSLLQDLSKTKKFCGLIPNSQKFNDIIEFEKNIRYICNFNYETDKLESSNTILDFLNDFISACDEYLKNRVCNYSPEWDYKKSSTGCLTSTGRNRAKIIGELRSIAEECTEHIAQIKIARSWMEHFYGSADPNLREICETWNKKSLQYNSDKSEARESALKMHYYEKMRRSSSECKIARTWKKYSSNIDPDVRKARNVLWIAINDYTRKNRKKTSVGPSLVSSILNIYDGYSAKPQICSYEEFQEILKDKSNLVLYKGVKEKKHSDQLKYGPLFNSVGEYGSGIYTTDDIATASLYAYRTDGSYGPIIRMILVKDAKIADYKDIQKFSNKYREYINKYCKYANLPGNNYTIEFELKTRLHDIGQLAEALGYDAVRVDIKERGGYAGDYFHTCYYYIILNRSKLNICEDATEDDI